MLFGAGLPTKPRRVPWPPASTQAATSRRCYPSCEISDVRVLIWGPTDLHYQDVTPYRSPLSRCNTPRFACQTLPLQTTRELETSGSQRTSPRPDGHGKLPGSWLSNFENRGEKSGETRKTTEIQESRFQRKRKMRNSENLVADSQNIGNDSGRNRCDYRKPRKKNYVE